MNLSDIEKLESKFKTIDTVYKKLLEENVKDIKELKALLSNLDKMESDLKKELNDQLLSAMPTYKTNGNYNRINLLLEYFGILSNGESITEFPEINRYLYLMQEPLDLNEYNINLKNLVELFEKFKISLSSKDFDFTTHVNEYMCTFFSEKNSDSYLGKMKEKFDSIYWDSHELLEDIIFNFRVIIYDNLNNLNHFFANKAKEFSKANDIVEETAILELYGLEIERDNEVSSNPVNILNSIKSGKLNSDDLSMNSSAYLDAVSFFMTEEIYDSYDKDDFIVNITQLRNNIFEYRYYNKFKYLVDVVADISSKKDDYKSVYTEKRNNIRKLLGDKKKVVDEINKINSKIKVLNSSKHLFMSEQSKHKKNDILNKKVIDQTISLNSILDDIRNEYKEYDISRFRETTANKVSKANTIFDDFKLYLGNIFALNHYIKENELELGREERDKVTDEFYNLLIAPELQIINSFNFSKDFKIEDIIKNKYKLLDIRFELDSANSEEILNKCNTIINAFNTQRANLDADILRIIEKYIIIKEQKSE